VQIFFRRFVLKNRLIGRGIFFTVFVSLGLVFTGCPADTVMSWNQGSPGNPDNPDNPNNFILITYDIILTNLYDELIIRVTGENSTPDLGILLEGEGQGNIMGQTADCQYICDAISAYANKNFQPASGTEIEMANMEYLLKMIDKANGDSTSYGTGLFATQQFVDTAAVTQALSLVILFKTQTWPAPGSYQIELPAGTYTMTAVSGRGGNGGIGGDSGALGNKATLNFTITSSIVVTVTVGGNGNSINGGSGGNPGNGGNGGNGKDSIPLAKAVAVVEAHPA
jgi:hypothetical protein